MPTKADAIAEKLFSNNWYAMPTFASIESEFTKVYLVNPKNFCFNDLCTLWKVKKLFRRSFDVMAKRVLIRFADKKLISAANKILNVHKWIKTPKDPTRENTKNVNYMKVTKHIEGIHKYKLFLTIMFKYTFLYY